MPWSIEDVDKHKKGLSEKQKKQWIRIANFVRKRCLAKGGTEKSCDAEAIKQANGAVNANASSKGLYSLYKTKQTLDYEPKLTIHQDKAHLVVPVTMMVEGVHNGSLGALLHTIDELGKFPASWDGIPVVIYHPEIDGVPVSANSPEIIDTRTVGRVYNTNVEGKKLKAEVWFDEDRLNAISAETLEEVNDSKQIEVSLGMFTEHEEAEGDYEGEHYIGIAHNHRPDHLAILPDEVGACSCADGCGLGVNEDKQGSELKSGKIEEQILVDSDNNVEFKKEDKMGKVNECPKCVEKINALIANKESGFVEDDREWLNALTESQLDKVTPKVIETKVEVEKVVEVNKLSAEDQADLAWAKQQRVERRANWIKSIQENTEKDTWKDEVLTAMKDDVLESVFKSVKKKEEPVDYSLGADGVVVANKSASGGPLYPAGVEVEETK